MGKMLSGKTAVVTGAGKRSGIGYAVACKLAAEGANIVIADLGPDSDPELAVKTGTENEMADIVAEIVRDHCVDAMAVNLDVTNSDSIARMVDAVAKRFEKIQILVNNAGASFGVPNAVHTYDETAWMKTIDVNLHGVFRVSRALLPMMILEGGTIINTASRAGKTPPLFNGAYAVAKAGVIMLTKVMASELAGNGVRVNAICPGQIATDLEKWRFGLEAQFFDSTIEEREAEMCKTIPLGRIGRPDEVGDLVVFLASDRSSYMTGQAINITGGQLMEL
ncbi:beta-ketoacyl-ACP reductase [Desulfosarcina widdelii]|uniref:Beta-ketoacyl-ACP reductase n=1 Tax=Desulfosarcina widdelii TaxID=947919 RepID=A0A5K7Z8K3_9BACT|nr:SDR family NAD(P)-dependent oxidoreductase [Desulfosarcina widdelii]BBO74794.1 beta-ketoacyl-ACP reductase [Desulfosarcina widdelii]